jgi:hypothetical protein
VETSVFTDAALTVLAVYRTVIEGTGSGAATVFDPAEPVPFTFPGGAAAFFALVGELDANPSVPADPDGFPRLVGWVDPCLAGTEVLGS